MDRSGIRKPRSQSRRCSLDHKRCFFESRHLQFVILATRLGIPTVYSNRTGLEAGPADEPGPPPSSTYRQVAFYAGRILKGERPADLPVIQSTKFEFIINLQTARILGLDVPPTLLARADEVIE